MLTLKNLTKTYKSGGGTATRALDGVSIEFPDKGMVFILGKSGSGKSTLLNVAGGLDTPDGGEVIVNGKSSKDFSPADFDSYRNAYVGFVFQDYSLIREFTVGQNIALALQLQGRKDNDEKVAGALALVGLEGFEKRKPNFISGGQRQRVAIARALVKDPEVIFADEPTGSLDSETGKDILNTLKKLSADRLVVVVSHDREFARSYGDRIIELKDGRIISDVTPAGAQTAPEKVSDSPRPTAKLIKSRLPVLRAAKMGLSSMAAHKVRFGFTLLLAVLSFIVFGVVSTMMTVDMNSTVASAVSASEYSTVLLSKNECSAYKSVRYDQGSEYNGETYTGESISSAIFGKSEIAQMNADASGTGLDFAGVFKMNNVFSSESKYNTLRQTASFKNNLDRPASVAAYYTPEINWFTDCGEEYLKRNFGTNCLLAGHYPTNSGEIALSEYHYTIFKKYGHLFYTTENNAASKVINQPADLIGEKISLGNASLTVSGVYNVGKIDASFEPLKNIISEETTGAGAGHYYSYVMFDSDLKNRFESVMIDSFHMTAFVTGDFYDAYGTMYNSSFSPLPFNTGTAYTSLYKNAARFEKARDGQIPFVSPESILKTQYASVLYYDGTRDHLPTRSESLLSPSAFKYSFAQPLLYASGSNGKSYGESHKDYAEAFNRIYTDSSPSTTTICKTDLATIMTGIKNDWAEWVGNKTTENYADYNKIYYGSSRLPVTIAGVVFSEKYSEINTNWFYVFDLDFVAVNTDKWQYSETEYKSNYTPPADPGYATIMSPSNNSYAQSYYIFGLEQQNPDTGVSYRWQSRLYSKAVSLAYNLTFWQLGFIAGGSIVGVIAVLFLINFITTSITNKRSEIGILRALGARRIDVFKVFVTESLIIALICFVLSALAAPVVCFVMNSLFADNTGFYLPVLNFGLVHVLLLLGITLAVSLLATIVPILLESKKEPMDSIRAI